MEKIELRRFEASDRDWLVAQHEIQYAQAEGFDASFGVLVAEIVDAFLSDHDPAIEAGWIACEDGQRLGSIFCVGLTEQTAKLRLFLLVPDARGKGLGHMMLNHCMRFARKSGYTDMQLWTHESHRAAGALYAKNGWMLGQTKDVVSFGKPNIEQHWHIVL
jgi:GNAT superfamily N-acetyltransferase